MIKTNGRGLRLALSLTAAGAMLLLGGCLARTALDVVTMPVRAVGQAADWATTSQDESDRNYGRKMRKKEAEEGREMRRREREDD